MSGEETHGTSKVLFRKAHGSRDILIIASQEGEGNACRRYRVSSVNCNLAEFPTVVQVVEDFPEVTLAHSEPVDGRIVIRYELEPNRVPHAEAIAGRIGDKLLELLSGEALPKPQAIDPRADI